MKEQREYFEEVSNCAKVVQALWTQDNKKRYGLKITIEKKEAGYTWKSFAHFAGMTNNDIALLQEMIQANPEVRNSGLSVIFERIEQGIGL
jgi:hypothetical protein